MMEEGLDFRATKDIDLVLIIEAVDADFGRKFWDYVKQAGYEHRNKSSGVPQFYRFSHPTSNRYPAMIELFTRKLDAIQLPDDAVLTPLPMDEDISSLSAILLDDDYYEFLKQGKVTVDGVTVLDAAYLIPFKAKAWMDLTDRKAAGEHVDSKNIKKHKNDVFRLTELIFTGSPISFAACIPSSTSFKFCLPASDANSSKSRVSRLTFNPSNPASFNEAA